MTLPVHNINEKCRVVEFAAWHFMAVELRELDRRALGPIDLLANARIYASTGLSFTLMLGGKPIACWGIVPFWPGVAELWLVTSPAIEKIPITFHKTAKNQIEAFIKAFKINRLETSVLKEHKVSRRWVEALGFDGPWPRDGYGPGGEDFVIYAKMKRN